MSKTIKLQEEELQKVKNGQERLTQNIFRIGQIEVQKANLLRGLEDIVSNNNDLGLELQNKYGEGDINLETGELTLKEETKSTK